VVAGAAVIAFSPGTYARYPRHALLGDEQQARAPGWTRPCWPHATDDGDPPCVHVTGRVVWIQRHDPDGDGDRHFVVMSRLHARIVKIGREMRIPLPHLGSRIDAVGYLSEGASGREEVDAITFSWR
jgi:hypothetical protein